MAIQDMSGFGNGAGVELYQGFREHSIRHEMGGRRVEAASMGLDLTQGLGAHLLKLGLITENLEIKVEDLRHYCLPGDDLILDSFSRPPEILLKFIARLHPEAILSLSQQCADKNGMSNFLSGNIAVNIDYDDGTREAVEEMVPVIVEMWKCQNGTMGKRAAMMLGMLIMEMLWGLAG